MANNCPSPFAPSSTAPMGYITNCQCEVKRIVLNLGPRCVGGKTGDLPAPGFDTRPAPLPAGVNIPGYPVYACPAPDYNP